VLVLVIGTVAVTVLGVAGVVTVRMIRHHDTSAGRVAGPPQPAPHGAGGHGDDGHGDGDDEHAAGGMGTGGPSVPPPATAIPVSPAALTRTLGQAGARCYRLRHQDGFMCYRSLGRHTTTEVAIAAAPPAQPGASARIGAVVVSTDSNGLDAGESQRFHALTDQLAASLLGRHAGVLIGATNAVHTDAAGLVVSAQFDRGNAAIRAPRFAGPTGHPVARLPRSQASIAADLSRDGWTCAAACRTGHDGTTALTLIRADDAHLSFQGRRPPARFVRRTVGDLLHATFPAAEPAAIDRLTSAAANGREQIAVLADMEVRVSGTGAGTRLGIQPVRLPA